MMRPLIAAAAFLFTLLAAGQATAQTLRPSTDENLEWAASVVQINEVPNQPNLGVKLFGLAGGDPAMNGLHTYIGFYFAPGDGWRVFEIGDFVSYRILSATLNRVTLEIQENTINRQGEIGTRTRRISLRWTPGREDERPPTVTVTPARRSAHSRHRHSKTHGIITKAPAWLSFRRDALRLRHDPEVANRWA